MKLILSCFLFLSLLSTKLWAQLPATLGWYEIPNSKLRSVGLANGFGGSSYNFYDQMNYLMDSWNGGTFDTTANRLLVWGGGHFGYAGNEIYAIDLDTLTVARLTDPGLPLPSPCPVSEYTGGGTSQPNVRHDYDSLNFLPTQNSFFVFGGAPWGDSSTSGCGPDQTVNSTWIYDFDTSAWTFHLPATRPREDCCPHSAYDANTDTVFVHDEIILWQFNPATNTYAQRSTSVNTNALLTATIDTKRKRFYEIGGGQAWYHDISAGVTSVQTSIASASGCSTAFGSNYPGVAYDPGLDRVVIWVGGNTIWLYDPAANSCSSVTYSGGPPSTTTSAQGGTVTVQPFINGSYGRWAYSPKERGFIVVNSVDQNAYFLRLQEQTAADFAARCNAFGVVFCNSFDTAGDLPNGDTSHNPSTGTGTYLDSTGTYRPSLDTSVKFGGLGSVRVVFPQNASKTGGFYRGIWAAPGSTGSHPGHFAQNSTMWVQYAQLITADQINSGFTWKQSILHNANATCASLELTHNKNITGGGAFPSGNTRCGSNIHGCPTLSVPSQFFEYVPSYTAFDCTSGSAYMQQGDYRNANCQYNSDTSGCFSFPPSVWVTYTWKYTFGTWDTFTSRIEAWEKRPGENPTKFIDVSDFRLDTDFPSDPTAGYAEIDLVNHMTDKTTTSAINTSTWYDELIISSQPIAQPGGTSISSGAPTNPQNFRLVMLLALSCLGVAFLVSRRLKPNA